MEYHTTTVEEIQTLLETNIQNGLNDQEYKKRIKKHGQNIVARDKKIHWYSIFFQQFANPLMAILLIAALASSLIGDHGDALVIGIAILLNVIVGFIQEWRAETTAQALRKYHTKHSVVIRNGKTIIVESAHIVPGDIVSLAAGDQVPTDVRLVEATDLQIEEAILTGESLPINKNIEPLPEKTATTDMTNMAFAGTYVVSGKGLGIAVATGIHTELGKIASLVTSTERLLTPLQKQIKQLSWFLGGLLITITLIATSIGLLHGLTLHEFFSLAVALNVAAVPEGLLITMTVILTIGMRRMLKRKALVKNLLAAETLGSVSVVCADKTGTLTQGKLGLTHIVSPTKTYTVTETAQISPTEKKELVKLLQLAVLNNDAQKTESGLIGDPLEIAVIKGAKAIGIEKTEQESTYKRISEIPFSAENKFMATVHKNGGKQQLIIKGAPEAVFNFCNDAKTTEYLKSEAEKLSAQGFRVIALASKDDTQFDIEHLPSNCTPQALLCFSDPLRPEAKKTVTTMQKAGIKVVMVTGDHPATAKAIAQQAGLDVENGNLIHGDDLKAMSDQELKERVLDTTVFARTPPHEKIRIVRAWQSHGKPTAMTGDGINDAPALKAADIGVAQGSGSEIAQSIAGIVLLDDNLATISAAIQEGRIIFDNIRKVIVYFLADGFTEIALVTGALLFGLPIPLLPTQILWINLVSDGLPSMALTAEPGEKGIMDEPPRKKNEPILNMEMKTLIFIIGIVTDIGLFTMYFLMLQWNLHIDHIRTIIFNATAIDSLFYVFATRTLRRSLFSTNIFSNMWLIWAVLISFFIQLMIPFMPIIPEIMHVAHLNFTEWGIIFGLAMIKLFAIELTKLFFRRKKKNGIKL